MYANELRSDEDIYERNHLTVRHGVRVIRFTVRCNYKVQLSSGIVAFLPTFSQSINELDLPRSTKISSCPRLIVRYLSNVVKYSIFVRLGFEFKGMFFILYAAGFKRFIELLHYYTLRALKFRLKTEFQVNGIAIFVQLFLSLFKLLCIFCNISLLMAATFYIVVFTWNRKMKNIFSTKVIILWTRMK